MSAEQKSSHQTILAGLLVNNSNGTCRRGIRFAGGKEGKPVTTTADVVAPTSGRPNQARRRVNSEELISSLIIPLLAQVIAACRRRKKQKQEACCHL